MPSSLLSRLTELQSTVTYERASNELLALSYMARPQSEGVANWLHDLSIYFAARQCGSGSLWSSLPDRMRPSEEPLCVQADGIVTGPDAARLQHVAHILQDWALPGADEFSPDVQDGYVERLYLAWEQTTLPLPGAPGPGTVALGGFSMGVLVLVGLYLLFKR